MVIGGKEFNITENPQALSEGGIGIVGRSFGHSMPKAEIPSDLSNPKVTKIFFRSHTFRRVYGGADLSKPIHQGEVNKPEFNSDVELKLGKMNEVRTRIQDIERYRHLSQIVLPRLAETITAGMIAARIVGII